MNKWLGFRHAMFVYSGISAVWRNMIMKQYDGVKPRNEGKQQACIVAVYVRRVAR